MKKILIAVTATVLVACVSITVYRMYLVKGEVDTQSTVTATTSVQSSEEATVSTETEKATPTRTVEEFNPAEIKSIHESLKSDPDEPDYSEDGQTSIYFTNTAMIDEADALLLREQELLVDATQKYLDSIGKKADSLTVIDGSLSQDDPWRKFAVRIDSDGSTLWISYNDSTEEFKFEVK